jgi:hypothetical protein
VKILFKQAADHNLAIMANDRIPDNASDKKSDRSKSDRTNPGPKDAIGGPVRAPANKRRSRGLLSLAVELDKVMAPMSRKKGFAEFDLTHAWPDIMGLNLAAQCAPQRLARGPDGRDGTLHLGVWGPLALELQHMTPQLVERINGHYGYRAVAKIMFHQTPPSPVAVGKQAAAERAGKEKTPAKSAQPPADLAKRAQAIEDPELRAALLDLGTSVSATDENMQSKTDPDSDASLDAGLDTPPAEK